MITLDTKGTFWQSKYCIALMGWKEMIQKVPGVDYESERSASTLKPGANTGFHTLSCIAKIFIHPPFFFGTYVC